MVLPVKDAAAQVFYDKLFEIDPSLRSLFRGDMRVQGEKLMQIMDAAVNGINQLEQIVPGGRRSSGAVTLPTASRIITTARSVRALLWTLDKALGSEFTPEVKDAWATVYGVLARKMREAAAMRRLEPHDDLERTRLPDLDWRRPAWPMRAPPAAYRTNTSGGVQC